MDEVKSKAVPGVIMAVLLLGTAAAVGLVASFGDTAFGALWPALPAAFGLGLLFFGFPELGLGLLGTFLIWLLANVDVLPEFSKSWPFVLIWMIVMVIVGFVRARSAGARTAH